MLSLSLALLIIDPILLVVFIAFYLIVNPIIP